MTTQRLQWSLLLLRLSVFLVMLMWTLDKFVNPAHAAKVFESFYFIDGLGVGLMRVIGAIELLVIVAFVAGLAKRWTYGFVLVVQRCRRCRRSGSTSIPSRRRTCCSSPHGRCSRPA
ncbi:hypothetical protein RM530_08440 [Algiphilus sp. W345]|uniref:Uncharacterized protein n=1 Tax=Banduia mediterranea TaxID=3075609 RepID=A0ABU2WHQ6_9GAMM|nr:hypothetical protein [Algiphilus sp. W345]MDT0497392.1 hypothetical protein [Algiphilus sp. W345]